jgi:hypothetical protein
MQSAEGYCRELNCLIEECRLGIRVINLVFSPMPLSNSYSKRPSVSPRTYWSMLFSRKALSAIVILPRCPFQPNPKPHYLKG